MKQKSCKILTAVYETNIGARITEGLAKNVA